MAHKKKLWRQIPMTPAQATLLVAGVIIIGCLIIWVVSPTGRLHAQVVGEKISLSLHPSADRAYAFGDEHFNVADPQQYDINAAQYFYDAAARSDPSLPYAYHQLARIAFLGGAFPFALSYIDTQILNQGDKTPPSYYVRGLIEGYTGDYADAERDYAHFLQLEPDNWAGLNDYAWILLKDDKPQEAVTVTDAGLKYYPENPWLLNSNATALYETGDIKDARAAVMRASQAVAVLTPLQWSQAYPGNDPAVAETGLETFKQAVTDNMHTILVASTSASQE